MSDYQFSKSSTKRLKQCHRELITLANEVIKYFDCTVITGHRTKEVQNKAFDDGNSKLLFPNSKHNVYPSAAIDLGYYVKGVGLVQNEIDAAMFCGIVIATAKRLLTEGKMTYPIRSTDWDRDGIISDTKFFDFYHFELDVDPKTL